MIAFGLILVGGAALALATGSVDNVVKFSKGMIKDLRIQGTSLFVTATLTFENTFPFMIPSNSVRASVFLRQTAIQDIDFSLPNIPANSTIDKDLTIELTIAKVLTLLGLSVIAAINLDLLKRELKLKGQLSSNGLTIPFERSLI